ncbi:hypothetical protein V2W30_06070 [Streptomyces sp. Q6]|uniref:Uncharacterized protein n=1 Tax=Streptomyces citrinus TaxID=3118173 RepID=A0ACD5A7Q0_9ACTN
MTRQAWGRPAAGREPAAAALLSWLADPEAPRLCVVSGAEASGKSTLLAWLIAHGTRPGTPAGRRVHGIVPLAGLTATAAAWMLADQLGVAARTPDELVDRLAADPRRTVIVLPDLHAAADPRALAEFALELLGLDHVRLIVEARSGGGPSTTLSAVPAATMDLDEPQWVERERYTAWAAERQPHTREPDAPPLAIDLDDPAAICGADPWAVTARYERSVDAHGGLRAAWLRAGASLTRDQSVPDRAVVLLAALGDDADPRLPRALADLAEGAPWRVVWRRVRGDIHPRGRARRTRWRWAAARRRTGCWPLITRAPSD